MRILVVEDDVYSRRNVVSAIEKNYPSADILAPESLNVCYLAIEQHDFEIIMVDGDLMSFPDVDNETQEFARGYKLLKHYSHLRKECPPIICLSNDQGVIVHFQMIDERVPVLNTEVINKTSELQTSLQIGAILKTFKESQG